MLTPELFRAIRRIEIRTRHLVNESLAGEYHSSFKGRGMEFDEVREYQPGDEVRSIDWNVTARVGSPFVKRYIEERELTVMLAFDASASGRFGTADRMKRELAAEIGAVLAFSAITNNDKVGLLAFTDQVELYIPPRKGRRHVLRLIRDLLAFKSLGRGTDINLALDQLNRTLKHSAIIFLISDFLLPHHLPKIDNSFERTLAATNRHHDLVAVTLNDPREMAWVGSGLVALEDAETGRVTWVDTADQKWRQGFALASAARQQARNEIFSQSGVDFIDIVMGTDYVVSLLAFFKKRALRWRR